MLFNADDLHDLAERLSGEHGSFSASNLVNYGQTVILRPGARTTSGVLLSGEAAVELLGEDYEVFPATLTYKPDVSSDGLDRLPMELVELEGELDRLDDMDDQFGARGERIRNRYMRVVGRFRRYAIKAQRTGKPGPRRRAAALLRRIRRIYSKMQERGIETGGLPTPRKIARQARRMMREFNAPQAAKVPNAVTPFELPSSPPAFGVEQEEADADLEADARAEVGGYLFGGEEHDYFGVSDDATPSEYHSLDAEAERLGDQIDEDDGLDDGFGAGGDVLRGRYERLANRYRRFAAKATRKGTARSSKKVDRLLNKIRKLYLRLQEKGIEVEGLTTPDELAEETSAFLMEAGEFEPKRRGRKSMEQEAPEGGDEDSMFGVESAPFDFIDEQEEIVFGLEAAIESARSALGLDEDLVDDDDMSGDDELSGDDEEEDDAEFNAFLEGEEDEDEDEFGDDEEEEEAEEPHEESDEPEPASVREARKAAKIARLKADQAKSDLRRMRAERKAERLSGDDEDEEDEDDSASEDKKSSRAKAKSKAKDSEDEIPEDEDDDAVAVQRAKLSKITKQASAILSDPKSAEAVSDLRNALQDARRLLSSMNLRLKKGSKNGGIDYGRLRPVPRGGGSDGITVIAVRRRARNPNATKVQSYAASFGMDSNGHMLDVFATDFLDRSEGFDALESMEAIQYATGPNDYLYGESEDEFGQDMMGRMFRTRGRELRGNMPGMQSGRLLQIASNPYRSRRSRRSAMQELRARYGAAQHAEETQAEEIGYLFVTRGRELMDQMPELRGYRLYNIFRNPYRSERVRQEALHELAARYAEDTFGGEYGRMFRVRGRRAVALVPQARSAKLLQVASNPYRSERVRAAAAAELAERHAAKQGLPAPVEVVPNPAAPQIVVQPAPITPTTAPVTSSIVAPAPAPAPAYVPVASPAFTQPAPAPVPAPAQPSAAYFQDQQALEREVAAALPSYYGYGGSMNAGPFPFGDEAPLPPPRRTGPEVFA
jgi:hypothetical protein